MLRIDTRLLAGGAEMERFTNLDTTRAELGDSRCEVGDHQVDAHHRRAAHGAETLAERNRATGAWRGELHDTHGAGPVVDIAVKPTCS